MCVVNIKARAGGRDHIGNANRVGIHNGHSGIALEIESAHIAQRMFFGEIPPRARGSKHCAVGDHRVRRGDDRGKLWPLRRRNTVFGFGT